MTLYDSLCKLCKHRQGFGCAAYPEKIPLEVRLMYVDHRRPYPGDHGLQFEPKDESPETLARIADVRVRKGRVPAGPRALDRRVGAVYRLLTFADDVQHVRFVRSVEQANAFEELPVWCQELVLTAEGQLTR
ncbi:MAG TPA: hypothetical protein VFE78_21930 [Gemmataceae bacterium]|jgi:hypothetical protein|nr:hypothetical protein [Gemmataceae bacterium]